MSKDASQDSTKRSKHEIARDRALVAEYRLKGLSFAKIADELNNRHGVSYTITDTTVRNDYNANIEMWNDRAMVPTEADIQAQKERLRMVEVEAWAAWERSKDPAETIKEVQKMMDIYDKETGEVIDQVLATESVEKLIKGQVGDDKFLRIVLDCWDKRAKLDGQYVTKYQADVRVREEKEVTFKMYKGVSPMMWDDPSIEVVDGRITKNGKPLQIVDGEAHEIEGDNDGV